MDYNVAAVSLASPPVPAFLQPYRPAIVVKNEGIHDADVTGMLRIYRRSTGLMIFAAPLAVAAVPPGETRQAIASIYWTPDEVGDYLVQGFVTTDRDQDPDDNQLPSVTVPVSSEPPPPPPVVPIHATQHEADGDDALNVDGLHGRLAETQSPAAHASSHGPAGVDTLSVNGLHGVLADAQPVEVHGNAQHSPAMATQSGLNDHDQDPAAHTLSSGLEHVSRRGVADGYPGLDASGYVPAAQLGSGGEVAGRYLRNDSTWQPATGLPGLTAASTPTGFDSSGLPTNVFYSTEIAAGSIEAGSLVDFALSGEGYMEPPCQLLTYVLFRNAGNSWEIAGQTFVDLTDPLHAPRPFDFTGRICFEAVGGGLLQPRAGGLLSIAAQPSALSCPVYAAALAQLDPALVCQFALGIAYDPAVPLQTGTIYTAYIGRPK